MNLPDFAPTNMVRKLSDLSDWELAPLFNMTVAEVRRRRKPPEESSFYDSMPEDMKTENKSYHEWLWNLSVEEFERLRKEGGAASVRLGVADVPTDVAGRYRALQDLLQHQSEFETRYPAAFEILFPKAARRRERDGLCLPSFDVRILNNWIFPHVFEGTTYSEADAHTSVSRYWQKDWYKREANRHVGALDLDDLQGVLLAILSREEDGERVGWITPSRYIPGDVEGVRSPGKAPIRLTDLRLAESLQPKALRQGIKPILDLLHKPLTAEHVVLWKLRVLGASDAPQEMTPRSAVEYLVRIPDNEIPEEASEYIAEIREFYKRGVESSFTGHLTNSIPTKSALLVEQFGDERTGTTAVSFAAAALWLFWDLDMRGIERESSYRLAEQIESLATTLMKLIRHLKRSSEELGKLVANKPAGANPEIPVNNYLALQHYRMGRLGLREAAEWLGLTPYSSRTGRGTRDWKARVKQRLREGKRFEDENFPRAAAIFANRDHPLIRYKARRAYRGYLLEVGRSGYVNYMVLGYWARTNAAATKRGIEIAFAYVQLGSCILQRIEPVP